MSQYKFFIEQTVRFSDMDAIGHVNNAVMLTYFEEARLYYMKDVGQLKLKMGEGPSFILAEALCSYRSPAFMSERLKIFCRTAEIGRASITHTYEIREATSDRLVAEGRTVLVCYDYQSQKSMPVPDDLRARLLDYDKN